MTILLAPLLGALSVAAAGQTTPPAADPTTQLHELFDEHHRWSNTSFPEDALLRGEPTNAGTITDMSMRGHGIRVGIQRHFLEELQRLDRSRLSPTDRLNAELFERELKDSIEGFDFNAWLMPIGPLQGPQQSIPQMADRMPFKTKDDFVNYLKRLNAVPGMLRDVVEVMRAGMEAGMLPPRVVVEVVPAQCDAVIQGRLETLREPFVRLPADIPPEEAAALKANLDLCIAQILKDVAAFKVFITDQYLPACRAGIGATELPNGKAYYNYCLRHHTTTPMTADQIHELGLAEVARIRAEMIAVIKRTDWYAETPERAKYTDETLFREFVTFLRSDPRFYHKSAEALLAGYREICKRIDAQLPALFGTLPRLTYGVREIPRFMAPQQTTAYYQPGSMDGGNPGYFCANTFALDQRPTYEMIPLALHEAVPGHHLQISIGQELKELPFFRRHGGFTAFVEGWALYSERLGIEMGFFKDPYADFGRLLYEMWRACRLVVDTGMHAKGWSRDRAIEFMKSNSALSQLNIEREIDRYIAWPGQACGYKIGELKIRELRAKAEKELGARFNLRAFHDAVLGQGAIPLSVLESQVNEWIESVKAAPPAPMKP